MKAVVLSSDMESPKFIYLKNITTYRLGINIKRHVSLKANRNNVTVTFGRNQRRIVFLPMLYETTLELSAMLLWLINGNDIFPRAKANKQTTERQLFYVVFK